MLKNPKRERAVISSRDSPVLASTGGSATGTAASATVTGVNVC